MKCKHAVELFDSYLKGTANGEERTNLENHLATCEVCRQQFELYRFYFSGVTVENDFPVPSQLNAKIKYAVYQQAHKHKKVPFWQNKRILATATACAFLFVIGIMGTSYFSKIKDASNSTNTEAITDAVQTQELFLASASETELPTAKNPSPRSVIVANESVATANAQTLEEAETTIPAYDGETVETPRHFMMGATVFYKNENTSPDLQIDSEWMDAILSEFPHEVLTEDTYLVTVTAEELETLMGCSVDADETKSQLTLQFVNENE